MFKSKLVPRSTGIDKHPRNVFVLGSVGRGGGKRMLSAYASYWGVEIPPHLKERELDFFFANEAHRLLKPHVYADE
ncbi:hypothetical protein ACFVS2_22065 [Brevibacillus sp. NPDC058079]|uniref:hypothetical protein n=1 Tax=Brevibacillus sp. NPDC058079 TaxID=3346330 RepID=UPI0036EE9525